MAFTIWAGTSGRLSSGLVAYQTGTDLPIITPSSITRLPNAEINKWSVAPKTDGGKFIGFENPVGEYGNVYEYQLQGGITSWSVQVSGTYNSDAAGTTDSKFPDGAFVVLDLIISKLSPLGRYGCVAKITDRSQDVDGTTGNPGAFSFTAVGSGALPNVTNGM
ncbi:hypothetical protein [Fimbriiglobus ruber]|uniref:Phage protein n=1 Tax=Fimbriiglobus ruber TaxID=1908690 RepID=A0A225D3T4_9BACT|nr:hypothetical protein [Fimbriiglobus ruber]OWK34294.1 hypothetical protein FRUB_10265 [Fimbriiglobus ruber]